jgi:hypothetical protein
MLDLTHGNVVAGVAFLSAAAGFVESAAAPGFAAGVAAFSSYKVPCGSLGFPGLVPCNDFT